MIVFLEYSNMVFYHINNESYNKLISRTYYSYFERKEYHVVIFWEYWIKHINQWEFVKLELI